MRGIYERAAALTGMFAFVITWGYLVASEGFLIGVVLGIVPSIIIGLLLIWLAPVVWVGGVLSIICLLIDAL